MRNSFAPVWSIDPDFRARGFQNHLPGFGRPTRSPSTGVTMGTVGPILCSAFLVILGKERVHLFCYPVAKVAAGIADSIEAGEQRVTQLDRQSC